MDLPAIELLVPDVLCVLFFRRDLTIIMLFSKRNHSRILVGFPFSLLSSFCFDM